MAAGPSVAPSDANVGWLRRGSTSVLDSFGVAAPREAFSKVEVSLNIGEPWKAASSSPGAEVRVEAVAVPALSTMLLSNLIKGTLIHVRAKVMNERSAAAVEEYSRTVGRWVP
jgi:hypothetical protein